METPDPDPASYAYLPLIILNSFFRGFSMEALIGLIALVCLLLCSALVSGSETGFFSLQPSDIEELEEANDAKSKAALKLRENPKILLATILISNNLVNVTIVLLSTLVMNKLFDLEVNPTLAFVLQVIIVTSLLLIFGEIIPKIYASKRPMKMVRSMSGTILTLEKILLPLSKILVNSTSFIDKRLARKQKDISMDDLSAVVDIATDGATPIEEKRILKGIASFSEKEVSAVMKPRMDILAVEESTPFRDMLYTVVNSGFSRIPVYKESLDQIAVFLYVKDLLPYLDEESFEWQQLIRPAFFIPENRKINDLFQDFREKKIHIAIIVDEYGGTSGLITMEDIIEEIVGEINDEYDDVDEDQNYTKLDNATYLFKAQTSLIDFCKVFGLSDNYFEPMQGEADTLAGLVLEIEGRIPEVGFRFDFEKFQFEITESDKRRIIQIKVTLHQ